MRIHRDRAQSAGAADLEQRPGEGRGAEVPGHWVGDIHQPLHVSFKDDRGGGKTRGRGACQTNLHSVWDTCLLTHTLGTTPRDIAQTLLDEITDEERVSWRAVPVHESANESLEVARAAMVGYCVRDGAACFYAEGRKRFTFGQWPRA